MTKKNNPANFLDEVGTIIKQLEKLGLQPVLVGGMALVILGSGRVTQDFDFVISNPFQHIKEITEIFYQQGLELASKLNQAGEIITTIDNRKVAEIRIKQDQPTSVYFINPQSGLRIDLLFDFPIQAHELAIKADQLKIKSHKMRVATPHDLLHLKKIALKNRSKSGDVEDIQFLKTILKIS